MKDGHPGSSVASPVPYGLARFRASPLRPATVGRNEEGSRAARPAPLAVFRGGMPGGQPRGPGAAARSLSPGSGRGAGNPTSSVASRGKWSEAATAAGASRTTSQVGTRSV